MRPVTDHPLPSATGTGGTAAVTPPESPPPEAEPPRDPYARRHDEWPRVILEPDFSMPSGGTVDGVGAGSAYLRVRRR